MADIHPRAIVDPRARLGDNVTIGAFSCVGPEVRLGDNVTVMSHAVVAGRTSVADKTRIFPFASIGHEPQDLKYQGESSTLEIGSDNIIREHVTMNPGTKGGRMVTKVGNHCLFMVGAHVAHDCRIEDHVVMANNATLGGHVEVGEYATLGGLSAVHQYVRIGRHAMIAGMSGIRDDIIPYGSVLGVPAKLLGLNIVGLKRRGFSREEIHALRTAYRLLFAQEGTMAERLEDVTSMFKDHPSVMDVVNFIQSDSSRAVCQPKVEHAA